MGYTVQMPTWLEIIPNWLWICDNAIADESISAVLDLMNNSSSAELDGDRELHLVGSTRYNYHVKRDGIRKTAYMHEVLDSLDSLYLPVFGKAAPRAEMNPLQFFTKVFEPNKSFYDMHVEDPKFFGAAVFMLYLSNEHDGELVVPSHVDSHQYITDGFVEMQSKLSIRYADTTISILPERNRCVVMRVGMAHLVKHCSGSRPCITGWSFASNEYYERFYNK